MLNKFSFLLKDLSDFDENSSYQSAPDLINEILNKDSNKKIIINKIINRDEDVDYIKKQLKNKDFNLYLSVNINYTLRKVMITFLIYVLPLIVANIFVYMLFEEGGQVAPITEVVAPIVWLVSALQLPIFIFFILKYLYLNIVNFIFNKFISKQ